MASPAALLKWRSVRVLLGLGLAGLLLIGAKRILRHPPALLGTQVSPLTLPIVANSSHAVLSIPGQRVLVLDFFESSCGPCRQTLPQAQHRIQDPGVEFVAVSLDLERDAAARAAEDWKLVKPVAWDETGRAKQQFQIVGIPALVVISKRGRVTGWFPYSPPDALLQAALEEARDDT